MFEIKRAIFDKIFIDREVVQEASACLVFRDECLGKKNEPSEDGIL